MKGTHPGEISAGSVYGSDYQNCLYWTILNVVGHSSTESLRDPKSRVQIRRGVSFSPTPIVLCIIVIKKYTIIRI